MDFVWKLYGNTYAVRVTVALVGVATLNLALPASPGAAQLDVYPLFWRNRPITKLVYHTDFGIIRRPLQTSNQCWSESGLGLGLNGWVRVRVRTRVRTWTLVLWTRTRTRTPPPWTQTQALWTRTLVLWTRTRTRTPPRWTRTHSESMWVQREMYKANLNFHVQYWMDEIRGRN